MIFIKKHRVFIIFSLLVAIIDASFVAITYFQAKNNLHVEEQQKALSHFAIFDVAYQATQENMLHVSSVIANTKSYRQLFLQGKIAVALEGGGAGKAKAQQYRDALNRELNLVWKDLSEKFQVRQLHFHLGPGSTSFLRLHDPQKFGDNLDDIRHTIVDTSTLQQPIKGFETGRIYSGIRGTSPVLFTNKQGQLENIGTVEAGASFVLVLDNMTKKSDINAAVFLYEKHLRSKIWPDYLNIKLQKEPSIDGLVLEETSSDEINALFILSQKTMHSHFQVLDTNINIKVLSLQDRQYLYSVRPLRDYIGSKDLTLPDAGEIVIWQDVTDLYTVFNQNFKINIYYSLMAFFLIELIILIVIFIVKKRLSQIIYRQTLELSSRSQVLEQLAHGIDLHKILESLVHIIEKEIPSALCSIQLLSHDGKHLSTGAAPSIPSFFNDKMNDAEVTDKSADCAVSAYTKKSVIVEDIQSNSYCEYYKKNAAQAELVSCWSFPIINSNDKVLGVCSLYSRGKTMPKVNDLDLIESVVQLAIIIIERKKSDESLQLLSRIYEQTHDGIVITDPNGIISDINPVFSDITGYQREDVIGKKPSILSSGQQNTEFYKDMWNIINLEGHWKGEVWNRKKDGEVYAEYLTISTIKNKQNETTHYVGLFSDITLNKKQQKSLELMAHYDVLTQLPNRTLFIDRFNQAIAHSKRNKTILAVGFLDLDEFKPVNDNYGHDVGDQLLIEVSARIKANLREEDTVSRQGGDEFTILLGNIESPFQSEEMLKRLNASLALPYVINDKLITISASIGVALYPQDSENLDILLRHADQAMYQAKLLGRNRYQMFSVEYDKQTLKKQSQLNEIEHALNNNEFSLYYQPKINMRTGDVYGVEALIRWHHPEKGLIPPLSFLPLIECTALEYKVGEWVVLEAMRQLNDWVEQEIEVEVSINISSNYLQSTNFVTYLKSILQKYPYKLSKLLQLEILESSALGDLKAISNIINDCQNTLGVNFALDDFGTGYSSLTHLRDLSVDTIKIDQSFVKNMLDDPNDYSIIQGVVGLANAFNRHVIAEGVESTEHGLMLLIMGCDYAQGYGIAKPMPADLFTLWFKKYTPNIEWLLFSQEHRTENENKIRLLKITTEHWVSVFQDEIKNLNEQSSLPILDHHKCHHGAWIQRAKQEGIFDIIWLEKIEKIHDKMHDFARELIISYHSEGAINQKELMKFQKACTQLQIIINEYE